MRNKLHSQSKYKFSTRNGYKKKKKKGKGSGAGEGERAGAHVPCDEALPRDSGDEGRDGGGRERPTPANASSFTATALGSRFIATLTVGTLRVAQQMNKKEPYLPS